MAGKKKAQDVPKVKKKMGRPTLYTVELADEICDVIASHSNGLTTLCNEREHWPHPANIFIWLRKYPEFREKYTRAKVDQIDASINLMQEMMDEPHRYHDEHGNQRVDVSLLRVKYDAIKWQASKLQPKQYGDSAKEEKSDDLLDEALKRKRELDEKNKKEY